jgi:hypothetical protein
VFSIIFKEIFVQMPHNVSAVYASPPVGGSGFRSPVFNRVIGAP